MPLIKISSSRCDVDDECAQCGGRLRYKAHAWSNDRGTYCTRRCAAQHTADMRHLAERWDETPVNPHVAPLKSWKVSTSEQGVILTLNGISFALGTSRDALIFDLRHAVSSRD